MPKDKSSGFYVDKYIIKCSDWKKLLGIKTDWNLPFDDQVQDLCKEAMREEKKPYRERSKCGHEKQPCNGRTCPRGATVYISHGKLKKTLRSTLKTKLHLFKNVINLSNGTFPDLKLSSLTKTFCPRPNL